MRDDIVPAKTQVEEPVVRLLRQMLDDAHTLQGLVVGYVRTDGNAAVRWTPMPAPMLSHLARIFELKVDRQYLDGMQTVAAPTRAPLSSPIMAAVKRAGEQARKQAQKKSPANRAKQAGKAKV